MAMVDKIKSARPGIKTILGGLTASFFSGEIMRRSKNVDFIIRGDAEVPLLGLMKEMSKRRPDFFSVPNLTWRNNGKIIHNEHRYVAGEADMDELDFSNFSLMKNFPLYSKTPVTLPRYSKDALNKYSTFYLCVGRGCPVNCVFCGGSRLSQRIINKRDKFVFRARENVLETIRDAVRAGTDLLYISFDPSPDRRYYMELFKSMRKEKIETSLAFECWSLPTHEFIDEFKKTFGKGIYSKIVLSPECASERLRKLNKGFFYTNSGLLDALQYLKEKRIFAEIYFSYPLPYETAEEVHSTGAFIELIKKKIGGHCAILAQDFGFDPASPIYTDPAKYNMTRKAGSFSDYCEVPA
jgi:radical SAM superfamily enzyme YgiQ (UPF0313 family)